MPITVRCPFYLRDRDNKITCEAGRQRWPDMQAKRTYLRDYCAGDWEHCTVARILQEYYERTDAK